MTHDLIVLGSEIEGVTASLTAARAGLRVALVDTCGIAGDRPRTSGPFLLRFLHETVLEIHAAQRLIGWQQAPERLREMTASALDRNQEQALAAHFATLRERLARMGVTVLPAPARFVAKGSIELGSGERYEAPRAIVATGARARRPARFPFDDRVICDPDSMSRVTGVPRSLLVIGADIVGCEYSCMLATLGTAVTLVDRRTRLLRFVDHDLREVLHEEMRRLGITIVLGERVERLEVLGSGEATHAVALLGSGRIERVDRVLVAAGGLPNVEDLGLEQLGISVTTQGVAVETDGMETCVAGTFAVGGVVDPLAPVGAAIHQGRRAALHAIGIGDSLGAEVPLVVHSVPEIGSVGLSEEACRHLGIECLVSRSPLGVSHGGRLRAPEGFLKLVAEKTTARLIGVHAIGPRASEIVNLGAAIMAKRTTLAEIANVSFSPGSACEAYHLAAVAGLERWSAGVGRGIGGLPDPPSHARTERLG